MWSIKENRTVQSLSRCSVLCDNKTSINVNAVTIFDLRSNVTDRDMTFDSEFSYTRLRVTPLLEIYGFAEIIHDR